MAHRKVLEEKHQSEIKRCEMNAELHNRLKQEEISKHHDKIQNYNVIYAETMNALRKCFDDSTTNKCKLRSPIGTREQPIMGRWLDIPANGCQQLGFDAPITVDTWKYHNPIQFDAIENFLSDRKAKLSLEKKTTTLAAEYVMRPREVYYDLDLIIRKS